MSRYNLLFVLLFIFILLRFENNTSGSKFFVHFSMLELSFQLEVSLLGLSKANECFIDGIQSI
ncbi:hypothetical protein [uncultured Shewanella sp.]|uniref:hypothetical protein n=1 Tax=uncultured Shewanella sp. TaxID=173975 RepID=UPI0026157479|nr:hypothetical protein [uncultured Shewanella sp.]